MSAPSTLTRTSPGWITSDAGEPGATEVMRGSVPNRIGSPRPGAVNTQFVQFRPLMPSQPTVSLGLQLCAGRVVAGRGVCALTAVAAPSNAVMKIMREATLAG